MKAGRVIRWRDAQPRRQDTVLRMLQVLIALELAVAVVMALMTLVLPAVPR